MPPLKFLIDACVDARLAHWLRSQGYDTTHLREEDLQKLPNGQIFTKATAEDRVVITHDLDFGEIAALTHGQKTSVIVFRLHNPRFVPAYRTIGSGAIGLRAHIAQRRGGYRGGHPPSGAISADRC